MQNASYWVFSFIVLEPSDHYLRNMTLEEFVDSLKTITSVFVALYKYCSLIECFITLNHINLMIALNCFDEFHEFHKKLSFSFNSVNKIIF